MINSADKYPSSAPILGIFSAFLSVLGLVVAAERSGLPVQWVEWFLRIIFFLILAFVIFMGRTSVEALFFGRRMASDWQGGGLVLGVLLYATSRLLTGGGQASSWLPCLLGSVTGLLAAHVFLRWQERYESKTGPTQTAADGPPGKTGSYGLLKPAFARGVACCALGAVIMIVSLRTSSAALSSAFGTDSILAMALVLFLALCSVGLGGARGALAITGILSLLVAAGILVSTMMGYVFIGPLPLPGFENFQTLQAIHALGNDWGLSGFVFFREWPSFSALSDADGVTSLVVSALVSSVVALTFAPVIRVGRRNVTSTAILCLVAMPLLVMAVAGYALEGAAELFVGTSINRPPAALLEATRLGLLSACGGFPETADALRVLCGVNPREGAVFDPAKLKPLAPFLSSGFPIALGFTAAINLAIRLFPACLGIMGVVAGLWIFAQGLGQSVFARQHEAPGLASYRIALTRIAALAGTLIVAGVLLLDLQISSNAAGLISGAAACVVVLIQLAALRSSMATPRKTAQSA